nr:MAG TPA: hypothetical protein [Caudoviricetes sp.]
MASSEMRDNIGGMVNNTFVNFPIGGFIQEDTCGKTKAQLEAVGVYKDGEAYMDPKTLDFYVYISDDKIPDMDCPYFTVTDDGKVIKSDSSVVFNAKALFRDSDKLKEVVDKYSEKSKRLKDLLGMLKGNELPTRKVEVLSEVNSLYDIISSENKDVSEKAIKAREQLAASTKRYVPVFKESDDFLKILIKAAIIIKEIDMNYLKAEVSDGYVINNLLSILKGDTKMSTKQFNRFCELLKVKISIKMEDDGSPDNEYPMKNPIIYFSDKDIIQNEDGETIDLSKMSVEARKKTFEN